MVDFTPSLITGDVNATVDTTVPVNVEGISLTKYSKHGAITNLAATTKTTIVTQSFVSGTFENLVMISCSGQDYAKFFLAINTVDIDVRRTGPDRNLTFDFTGAPYQLVTGDVVEIKVEHFNSGDLLDFDATIYGYEN
jgi:hypothetical protein